MQSTDAMTSPAGAIAAVGPASSIDEVIERMHRIDAALPADDGVAYFNRLYLKVTETVRDRTRGSSFEDPRYLERLDVVFANRYFAAYDADAERRGCPDAWAPLFDKRTRPHTDPIQFALAGMNAHINNDLPIAVVDTSRELGSPPQHDSPQCRDYHKVNGLLGDVEELMKAWFVTGVIARVDVACGKLDDAFAMWSISAAREIAWLQAHMLWRLRDELHLTSDDEHLLGRVVNLAGNGLLV
jgi:hypothetical protein